MSPRFIAGLQPWHWRFARCTRARRVSRTDTSTIWWNRKSNQDNKPMSPSFRQTCLGIFLYSAPIPFRSPPNNLNCRSLAIRMDNADPKKHICRSQPRRSSRQMILRGGRNRSTHLSIGNTRQRGEQKNTYEPKR
jgi:hypothetical protein